MNFISSYCCWGGETSSVTSGAAVAGEECWSKIMKTE